MDVDKTMELLEEVISLGPGTEHYAILSCAKEKVDERLRVLLLEDIYHKYGEDPETAAFYAKGLVNLSMAQKEGQAENCVQTLEQLAEDSPQNEQVAAAYVKGLVGLSINKGKIESAVVIQRLEKVVNRFPDNEEIGLSYAIGLMNLVKRQEHNDEISVTVEKLRSLAFRFHDSQEIMAVYAKGLVILLIKQEERDAAVTVDKLEALTNDFPDKPGIEKNKGTHSKILVDFLKKHNTKELMVTMDGMKTAMGNHRLSHEAIVVEYAKGLLGLSIKQGNQPPPSIS